MNELKSCPFCGGYAHLDKSYSYFRDIVIYCEGCDTVFTLDDCDATAEDVVNAWNRRAETSEWIPVTERLPEEEQSVLVVRKFLGVKGQVPPSVYVEIAERIGDDWYAYSDEYKVARSRHTNPTHWMPLPEPPKEET